MISIRQHCIPCYDEILRMESVVKQYNLTLSKEFELEQKTAGDIVKKLHLIVKSDWFEKLPSFATIKSGANNSYFWDKSKVILEEQRIWKECKSYVQ